MLLLSLVSCSVVFVFLGSTCASPVPSNIKYDQRQEGEWNVRADLENFVILIIPTTSGAASGSSPASASLLDLLSKAVPHRGHNKRIKHLQKNHQHHHETENIDNPIDTEHFIESKTAPYHVDISRSRAKLHPHIEDFSVTKRPSIKQQEGGLVHQHKRPVRLSKAYIVTVPEVLENLKKEITKSEPKKSVGVSKKDLKKKQEKVGEKVIEDKPVEEKIAEEKHLEKEPVKDNKPLPLEVPQKPVETMKLLGAENEQCGPGLKRDSYGICRIVPE